MRHRSFAIAWSLALAPLGCSTPERTADSRPVVSSKSTAPIAPELAATTPSSASPASAAAPVPSTPAAVAPLDGSPFIELAVDGYGPAVVAVPLGETTPQRVILATHGNYDHPDWQCSTWRGIVGPRGFVVCPRGVGRPDSPSRDDPRFTYASNAHLEKEIEATLAALRARFAGYVGEGPIVYTGFSLGAIMGVAIAARAAHPGRYESMVLVEGGHDRWKPESAAAFAKAGGKRVLFACGQASCLLEAKRAAAHLERAGVATKIVGVKDASHSYGGKVADEVKAAWPFIDGGATASP